jgi:hypothetical protein
MAYFRQRRVRAGTMCFAGAVRQLISTFSTTRGLRRIRIGIIV